MSQIPGWFRPVPPPPAPSPSAEKRPKRPPSPYAKELERASQLARIAGGVLLKHYGTAKATLKAGGSPVTAADHDASHIIVEGLRRYFPNDAVVSEEEAGVSGRTRSRRLWLVDPLDGTKEFLAQNGEFSIMIGLAVGGNAVMGVVYAPALDLLWGAAPGIGAFVEEARIRRRLTRAKPRPGAPLRFVGSRSHADPLVVALAAQFERSEIVPSGSVGLKCARIAEGMSDVYVHPIPYMKAWDLCAPEAILRHAGGTVTDCLGQPLRYRRTQPEQPHGIVACAPELAPAVMKALAPLYAERVADAERKAAEAAARDAAAAASPQVTPDAAAPASPAGTDEARTDGRIIVLRDDRLGALSGALPADLAAAPRESAEADVPLSPPAP